MKPFNCVETIAILMCKQMSSNSFENEITYKVFTYKHAFNYVQIND